jgi:HEAT repeat protein
MLVGILHNSVNPFQREWAAESLAATDWRANPEVVPALVQAARDDTAATVRTACVRRLVDMRLTTPKVVETLQALKADPDPRVRYAAEEGLTRLGGSLSPVGSRPSQPAQNGLLPRAN